MKKNPRTDNLLLTDANTEYSYTFQQNVKGFTIQARNGNKLQFSFQEGQSGSNYVTIPGKSSFTMDDVSYEGVPAVERTLRIQSDNANEVLEIVYWR